MEPRAVVEPRSQSCHCIAMYKLVTRRRGHSLRLPPGRDDDVCDGAGKGWECKNWLANCKNSLWGTAAVLCNRGTGPMRFVCK